MQRITVEPGLEQKLAGLADQVLICDSQGNALGSFSPFRDRPKADDLQLEPPLSMERINEIRKNPTGKPLSEILNRLGLS